VIYYQNKGYFAGGPFGKLRAGSEGTPLQKRSPSSFSAACFSRAEKAQLTFGL
jgi:hypothetical protein